MHLIGDRLTVTGLQLVGLKKGHVADKNNVRDILLDVSELAQLILITHDLSRHVKKDIEKFRRAGKIVVEIPDRTGGGEAVNELVKDAVGFDIKK